MNAYELADELLRDNTQLTVKAAYMLRQQADRIVELEKRKWSEQDIKNACIGARLSEEDFFRIKAYLPVYSSPQTKPLSDEEIQKMWKGNVESCGWESVFQFARAIEERHGIK